MNQKNSIRISFLLTLLIPLGAISQIVLCYYILKFNKIVIDKIIKDKVITDNIDFIEY